MQFKLDENFGNRTSQLFHAASHDAETVRQERLSGCPDEEIYQVRIREQRCLVTLDLDFPDVPRFRPHNTSGIAVLRLPKNPTLSLLTSLVASLLSACGREPIAGRLWIVEPGRIRVHNDTADDPE